MIFKASRGRDIFFFLSDTTNWQPNSRSLSSLSPVVATGLPLRRSRLACLLPSKHLVARLFIPGLWSWLCAAQGLEVDFESLQIVLSRLRVT